MGSSYSSNVAKSTISVMNKVINNAMNTCKTTIKQNQVANIHNNTGGTINLNINWKQIAWLDMKCIASNTFSNTIDNQLSQEAKQVANAVVQQFSLFEFADASNYVEMTMQASNTVKNTFNNSCITDVLQNQAFNYSDNNGTYLTGTLNWTQTTQDVSQCIFKNQAINNIVNDMSQTVNQSATAKQENFLAAIISAILLVIIVVAIILFGLLFVGLIGFGGVSAISGISKSKTTSNTQNTTGTTEGSSSTNSSVSNITSGVSNLISSNIDTAKAYLSSPETISALAKYASFA